VIKLREKNKKVKPLSPNVDYENLSVQL